MTTTEPIAISLPEAARLLGCSAEHLRRLALDGERFGAYRMGHRWLVHRDRLLAYIEEQQDNLAPSTQAAAVPRARAASSGDEPGPGCSPPFGAAGPGSSSPAIRSSASTNAAATFSAFSRGPDGGDSRGEEA